MCADRDAVMEIGNGRLGQQAANSARWQAWAWVVAFFVLVNGVEALYAAAEVELSATQTLLIRVLAIMVFWMLLLAECQPYRVSFPLDAAFFLYATSFLTLFYYLWRTQRWHGVKKVLFVVAIWGVTYAAAQLVGWSLIRM